MTTTPPAEALAPTSPQPKSEPKPPMDLGARGLELRTLEDGLRMAKYLIAAKVTPEGDSAETVFIKLQAGLEHGFPPTAALKVMCVINGRLSIEGKGLLAIIRRARVGRILPGIGSDGNGPLGYCEFERFDTGEKGRITFTRAEAKIAGLYNKPGKVWQQYEGDMLMWRAVSRCADRYFSDITMGLEPREVAETYEPTPYTPVTVLPADQARALPAPPATADPLLATATVIESADEQPAPLPCGCLGTCGGHPACKHPGLPAGLLDNLADGEEVECKEQGCGEIIRGPGKNVKAKADKGKQGRIA